MFRAVSHMKPLAWAWAHAHHPPTHSDKPWQAQNTVLPVVEPTRHTRALQALYPCEKESLTLSRVRKYLLAREQSCVPKCLSVFIYINVISRDGLLEA
jgi:hypothetical protein